MEISLAISIISLLVAVAAAIYAKASVVAASAANEIAKHNYRLRIFRGILELRGRITGSGVHLSDRRLFELYEYFEMCEFYFSSEIAALANEFFDAAKQMVAEQGLVETARDESAEKGKKQVQKAYESLKRAREIADELEVRMKAQLRLEES